MTEDTPRARLLLIDDDEHLLRILSDFLTYEGYDIRCAKSGEAGLELLKPFNPDLIILDIGMPGMGGIGFLRKLSDDRGHPRYPVLVLTARSAMKDFFDTIEVAGFLPKPCSTEDLAEEIRTILPRHNASRATSNTAETEPCILLGEDDRVLADSIKHAMTHLGYTLEIVDSGPNVLEAAVETRPSAIVMNEILPLMNGSVVAKLARTMAAIKDIPILIYDPSGAGGHRLKAIEEVDMVITSSTGIDVAEAVQALLRAPSAH